MPHTALITGASSGIGAEFARYHAAKGGDVILSARSKGALDSLADELRSAHGITAHVFAADLGTADGVQDLVQRIEAAGLGVDILINNAGFGGQGRHIDRDLTQEQAMIDLNVKALVALTHHFGGRMAANDGGRILNVASSAAFMPGPMQGVYFATKAFVKSFSEAVAYELRNDGVSVTVLAPGYVDTAFADRADLHGTNLVKGAGKSAASVAKHGYDAMLKGKLVTVNEKPLSLLVNWIIPLLPRWRVLKLINTMQTK